MADPFSDYLQDLMDKAGVKREPLDPPFNPDEIHVHKPLKDPDPAMNPKVRTNLVRLANAHRPQELKDLDQYFDSVMFDKETGKYFGEELLDDLKPGQTISQLLREREAFGKTPEGIRAANGRLEKMLAEHRAKYPEMASTNPSAENQPETKTKP